MTDYSRYCFSGKEWCVEILRAAVMTTFTGFLFFNHVLGAVILFPAGILLIRDRRKKKKGERLAELRSDFKEFITSFAASIQAGYTMEQSMRVGMEDLRRMYPGTERCLVKELEWMGRQLELQIPCDELFSDLAQRSGLEEIRSFAVVMNIGRRQGGNLVRIIRRTVEHLNRKIQVEMEVEQAVAGRMMEKNVMFYMPYFMLLYLRVTNGSYMEILFSDFMGQCLLMCCLLAVWGAGKWADRVVNIKL